jgi:hypothetical protein
MKSGHQNGKTEPAFKFLHRGSLLILSEFTEIHGRIDAANFPAHNRFVSNERVSP